MDDAVVRKVVRTFWIFKQFCIPESLNTNISQQLFDYKINFVIFQRENTNSKDDFVLKTCFNLYFKDFWYTKWDLSQKKYIILIVSGFILIFKSIHILWNKILAIIYRRDWKVIFINQRNIWKIFLNINKRKSSNNVSLNLVFENDDKLDETGRNWKKANFSLKLKKYYCTLKSTLYKNHKINNFCPGEHCILFGRSI